MASEICETCGEAPATIQCIEVVAGAKKIRMVCESCLAEKGVVIDPGLIKKTASHLFEAIPSLGSAHLDPTSRNETGTCVECGLTWLGFKQNSRLGCAQCYEFFASEVSSVLDRLHGATQHEGRVPERARAQNDRRRKLSEIRAELDDAIRSEDYERAARLRDSLQTLDTNQDEDASHGAR
ncbi:MAG: hypothetical protein CMJ83_00290 [Planctomycetes bacterium]|nr:hypothetical protein [Planctomycetota bacterium]